MFIQARRIVESICQAEGITLETLISRSRTKTIAQIRHRAARVLREKTNLSWAEIGGLLNRTNSYRGERRR